MGGARFTMKDLFDKGFNLEDGKGKKVGVNRTITEDPKVAIKKAKTSKPKGFAIDGKSFIEYALIAAKIEFVKEHKFDSVRKFRFDFAILDKKVGIEYDGLMSDKSRHTTISGFTNDCNKTNLAQLSGWKVLRYTATNFKNIVTDLEKI